MQKQRIDLLGCGWKVPLPYRKPRSMASILRYCSQWPFLVFQILILAICLEPCVVEAMDTPSGQVVASSAHRFYASVQESVLALTVGWNMGKFARRTIKWTGLQRKEKIPVNTTVHLRRAASHEIFAMVCGANCGGNSSEDHQTHTISATPAIDINLDVPSEQMNTGSTYASSMFVAEPPEIASEGFDESEHHMPAPETKQSESALFHEQITHRITSRSPDISRTILDLQDKQFTSTKDITATMSDFDRSLKISSHPTNHGNKETSRRQDICV